MNYSKFVSENIDDAIDEITRGVDEIKDVSQAGFWEAGLKIMNESQKLAPVDSGNLRASGYVRSASKTKTPEKGFTGEGEMPNDKVPAVGVEIGYYAFYAFNVHEMIGQKLKGKPRENFAKTKEGVDFGGGSGKGTYWDTGQPKFLESVVVRNVKNILEIIKKRTDMVTEKRNKRVMSVK